MLGSILGGIGSIFGGLLGYKGSRESRSQSMDLARNQVSMRVADARRAGISPLAALGITPYTPSPSYTSGLDSFSRAGQQLGDAATKYMDRDVKKAVLTLDLQKKKAEVQNMGLQNDKLRKEINSTPSLSGGSLEKSFGIVGQGNLRDAPIGSSDVGISFKRPEVNLSKQLGVESGVKPFYGDRIDDTGFIWRMPSESTAEILESSLPDWMRYNLERGSSMLHSAFGKYFASYRPALEKRLGQVRPISSIPGYEYRWNFHRGAWRLVAISGKKSKLFDDLPKASGIGRSIKFKGAGGL